ncbi:MAG: glycosyltransferase family 2 protein, partial [Gaiellaceae bacterium]
NVGVWAALTKSSFVVAPRPQTAWTIDVLIRTFGEPLSVLRGTVEAAIGMDLPHRTFVLDDAGRPEVERLAVELGAEYVARPQHESAKAGNLNHALRLTSGELVVVLDADHVAKRDFLARVVGYFEDPDVAIVQTPQAYRNAAENPVARLAHDQQLIFYGPVLRGRNGSNSVFACGTNCILRRAALEQVGGFDETSVVEDFATSMHIHRNGWRSVYYPYVIAEGLGPTSLAAYSRQQYRWARGSLEALVRLEPFRRGFSRSQRSQYLCCTLHYLTGLATVVYVVLPPLYFTTGIAALSPHASNFVLVYGAYFSLVLATLVVACRGQLRLAHLQANFGAFPVYAAAALATALRLPARFRVTNVGDSGRRVPVLILVTPIVFATTIATIPIGIAHRPADARLLANISWALINLTLLWGVTRAALIELGIPVPWGTSRRTAESEATSAVVPLATGGQSDLASRDRDAFLPEESRLNRAARASGRAMLESPWLAVAVITSFGLWLRFLLLDAQGLSLDENSSLGQAKLGLSALVHQLASRNVHVPLYHVILHEWIRVAGTSDIALRIPSVMAGTLAIPLLYLVGRQVFNPATGLVAATFGAFSPVWVWHSDEARMYPLLLCVGLASTYALLRALERGGFVRWATYAVLTALCLYTHYFAALLLLAHAGAALLLGDRSRRVHFLLAASLAVALFLPWIELLFRLRFQQHGHAITNGAVTPGPSGAPLSILSSVATFLLVFLTGYRDKAQMAVIALVTVGAWPLLALAIGLGARARAFLRTRASMFLVFWLLSTVGTIFVLNAVKGGVLMQRYAILASPPLFLLLARGLLAVIPRALTATCVAALVLMPLSVATALDRSNPVKEDFRSASDIILEDWHAGDRVFAAPGYGVPAPALPPGERAGAGDPSLD